MQCTQLRASKLFTSGFFWSRVVACFVEERTLYFQKINKKENIESSRQEKCEAGNKELQVTAEPSSGRHRKVSFECQDEESESRVSVKRRVVSSKPKGSKKSPRVTQEKMRSAKFETEFPSPRRKRKSCAVGAGVACQSECLETEDSSTSQGNPEDTRYLPTQSEEVAVVPDSQSDDGGQRSDNVSTLTEQQKCAKVGTVGPMAFRSNVTPELKPSQTGVSLASNSTDDAGGKSVLHSSEPRFIATDALGLKLQTSKPDRDQSAKGAKEAEKIFPHLSDEEDVTNVYAFKRRNGKKQSKKGEGNGGTYPLRQDSQKCEMKNQKPPVRKKRSSGDFLDFSFLDNEENDMYSQIKSRRRNSSLSYTAYSSQCTPRNKRSTLKRGNGSSMNGDQGGESTQTVASRGSDDGSEVRGPLSTDLSVAGNAEGEACTSASTLWSCRPRKRTISATENQKGGDELALSSAKDTFMRTPVEQQQDNEAEQLGASGTKIAIQGETGSPVKRRKTTGEVSLPCFIKSAIVQALQKTDAVIEHFSLPDSDCAQLKQDKARENSKETCQSTVESRKVLDETKLAAAAAKKRGTEGQKGKKRGSNGLELAPRDTAGCPVDLMQTGTVQKNVSKSAGKTRGRRQTGPSVRSGDHVIESQEPVHKQNEDRECSERRNSGKRCKQKISTATVNSSAVSHGDGKPGGSTTHKSVICDSQPGGSRQRIRSKLNSKNQPKDFHMTEGGIVGRSTRSKKTLSATDNPEVSEVTNAGPSGGVSQLDVSSINRASAVDQTSGDSSNLSNVVSAEVDIIANIGGDLDWNIAFNDSEISDTTISTHSSATSCHSVKKDKRVAADQTKDDYAREPRSEVFQKDKTPSKEASKSRKNVQSRSRKKSNVSHKKKIAIAEHFVTTGQTVREGGDVQKATETAGENLLGGAKKDTSTRSSKLFSALKPQTVPTRTNSGRTFDLVKNPAAQSQAADHDATMYSIYSLGMLGCGADTQTAVTQNEPLSNKATTQRPETRSEQNVGQHSGDEPAADVADTAPQVTALCVSSTCSSQKVEQAHSQMLEIKSNARTSLPSEGDSEEDLVLPETEEDIEAADVVSKLTRKTRRKRSTLTPGCVKRNGIEEEPTSKSLVVTSIQNARADRELYKPPLSQKATKQNLHETAFDTEGLVINDMCTDLPSEGEDVTIPETCVAQEQTDDRPGCEHTRPLEQRVDKTNPNQHESTAAEMIENTPQCSKLASLGTCGAKDSDWFADTGVVRQNGSVPRETEETDEPTGVESPHSVDLFPDSPVSTVDNATRAELGSQGDEDHCCLENSNVEKWNVSDTAKAASENVSSFRADGEVAGESQAAAVESPCARTSGMCSSFEQQVETIDQDAPDIPFPAEDLNDNLYLEVPHSCVSTRVSEPTQDLSSQMAQSSVESDNRSDVVSPLTEQWASPKVDRSTWFSETKEESQCADDAAPVTTPERAGTELGTALSDDSSGILTEGIEFLQSFEVRTFDVGCFSSALCVSVLDVFSTLLHRLVLHSGAIKPSAASRLELTKVKAV